MLFRQISFSTKDFAKAWDDLNIWYLIVVLPVVIIVLAIKAYRWKLLLHSTGFFYKYLHALRAYLSSYSVGVVTPGRLGELIKVYNVRKEIQSIDAITAFRTVVVDRLFDLFFLSWFGLAGLFFYFDVFGVKSPWILILISFAIVFSGLLLLHFFFKVFLKKHIKKNKILLFTDQCIIGLLSFKNILAWVISFIAYFVFFLGIQILLASLQIHINFIETGFIISLIGLILLLPISVAGFGTREAGLIYLLSFYGINAEIAISFSLLQFSTFFVWGGLIGLIFWLASPVSLEMIKEDSKKIWAKLKNRT